MERPQKKAKERRKPKSEGNRLKKGNDESRDPTDGTKFTEVDLSDADQVATLHYRGEAYMGSVEATAGQLRIKVDGTEGFWDEERKLVSVRKPKGKAFNVMGFTDRSMTSLYPEEAMWMLDLGKMAIRASEDPNAPYLTRSWLWERLFCSADMMGLRPEHFSAYLHLRNSGYVVRRWNRRAPNQADDASAWQRMMENPGGIEDGTIVFETWPPPAVARFRRTAPPPSLWRVLPWSIDADFGAALMWSQAAGEGAMMALSSAGGSRCSFLSVAQRAIGRNPRVPAPRDHVLRPAAVVEVEPDAPPVQGTLEGEWFPTSQRWADAIK